MERLVRKFQTIEAMNESDIQQALSLTPEERLHNLTALKKQYLAFHNLSYDDLDGHLRNSKIEKLKVPWFKDETP